MSGTRCACGFAEAGDETMTDHLLEVFTPADGRGADGMVHFEGERGLFCLCGAGGSAPALDSHFLDVFTPSGSAGPDGVTHKTVS